MYFFFKKQLITPGNFMSSLMLIFFKNQVGKESKQITYTYKSLTVYSNLRLRDITPGRSIPESNT
jgi:hypothetical protein